jgi:hypothetical protein
MTISSAASAAAGFSLTFVFPVGCSVNVGRISSTNTTTQLMITQVATSGTPLTTNLNAAINAAGYAELQLAIVVGVNAGLFTPSFLSGAGGSTMQIFSGLTTIQLEKV